MITTNVENQYMTLDEFRKEFNELISVEERYEWKFKELVKYLNENRLRLPLFYENNATKEHYSVEFKECEQLNPNQCIIKWNGKYFADTVTFDGQRMYITVEKVIGNTWLFRNDRSEGRPIAERLARILLGNPEHIPEFYVAKIEDYFECIEGNHRIYGAFLLNRTIKIDCYEEMKEIKLTIK